MIVSSVRDLMNIPEKEKREIIEKILEEKGFEKEKCELVFAFSNNKEAYLKTDALGKSEQIEQLKNQVLQETGIIIYSAK